MNKKDDSINLDLIHMVQNARMLHDKEAMPSKVPGVYWIEAKNTTDNTLAPTPRTGEWRIATTVDVVDAVWASIKQATESAKLGYKSKVSTVPAHGQSHRDERLICVRTYDADDGDDVERVRQALAELGFENLPYIGDKG
ncbi:MAG: DUF1917 domain-containing protein [Anaerolineae bacterium]|nr:DUF1917 domain-containing protein [Anaerolineae bacterium]MDQ7036588.1 DUF1917 domain-containing protein [Anaerolineae bacterium]